MKLCCNTIQESLAQTVARFGDRCAIETPAERYTWREIGLLSDAMADRLLQRGIRRGDHVALWGGNSLSWILTFLAVIKLEAVAVLINNNYTERELSQVLELSGAKWLCFGQCPILDSQPGLPARVMSACGAGEDRTLPMEAEPALLRSWLSRPAKPETAHGDPNRVCCLLFTSGSTERPKCVMMNHYSLVNNAVSMAEKLGLRPSDRICLSIPLFHIFCLCSNLLAGIYAGASIAIPEGLKSVHLLRCVERHACTILNGVPTSYLALVRSPDFSLRAAQSLRLGVMGGAPILERPMADLQRALPHTEFMINYGQTEGGCICNTEHGDGLERLAHTVGRPLPHITVGVADPVSGRLLGPGQVGELVVRGYSVMQGFYPPTAPQRAVDDQGWLHTEDLGRIDENGYVTIAGRKKDIIIRCGEDITPREIETVILAYEPVLDVKVFGIPHEVLGEQVVACIVARPGAAYREEELWAWMQQNLAPFKIPSYLFCFHQFPLCANGKLDIQRLKRSVSARTAGMGHA